MPMAWHGIIANRPAPLSRTLALALLALATQAPCADAGHAAPTPMGPPSSVQRAKPQVLAFDPTLVDFGPMYVGKTRHARVKVTNASDAPATISRIIPGCACTKASDPPKGPIAPGASFMLDVSLDGGDYSGTKLRKAVNFLIEGRETELLWLQGDVETVIAVSPQVVDARRAVEGEAFKVRLESARFINFTVRGVEPAGVVTIGTEASTEHELSIAVSALKAAGMPTKLTVTTDHPDAETIFVLLRVPPPPPTPQDSAPAPPLAPATPPSRG
jgi:hypothetical protein